MTDEWSNASPRPLPWDLRFNAAQEAIVESDGEDCSPSLFSWPEDPEERTVVPFFLSQREYTVLASCIDVGSDIAYGKDALKVWWLWTRNMRCQVPLCDAIAQAILTCEDVQAAIATLIATNVPVQNAIRNFVTGDTVINQYVTEIAMQEALGAVERARNLLKPGQCNPDFIFNQVSVLVQLLHDVTEDLFEAIEVGTNALERGSIITSSIPVFGQVIPADELLQFADQLVEEVAEDYSGAYDEGLYDTIRCDLFCLFKDDCTISIDQAITFYENKAAQAFPDDPWEALKAIIGYLNVGDFGGDTPVYLMHLLVLALIRQMQTVLGVDFGILALRVTAAGDDANNDWIILCDSCGEPDPNCYDLTTSANTWAPVSGNAKYYAGQGWGPLFYVPDGKWYFRIVRPSEPVSRTIYAASFRFNAPQTNITIFMNGIASVFAGPVTEIVMTETTHPAVFPWTTGAPNVIGVWYGVSTNPVIPNGTLRLQEFCLYDTP